MLHETILSPVDFPFEAPMAGLRWTSEIVATAALMLLLFNAGAVRGWASELPPGPLTEPAIAAADGWTAATEAVGLDRPVETMRGWWREAQAARFAGEAQR
jgi:hypothetical protein